MADFETKFKLTEDIRGVYKVSFIEDDHVHIEGELFVNYNGVDHSIGGPETVVLPLFLLRQIVHEVTP